MKKYRILLFLFGLFLFLPITKVKAYDEYTLKIVDDTTIEVHDQNMNLRSGEFSGTVYSWNQTTKTLTLKDGIHYTCIESLINEITITSDNDDTFNNYLKGLKVNLRNLNSSNYSSAHTYEYATVYSEAVNANFTVEELGIIDSSIKLQSAGNSAPFSISENKIQTKLGTTPVGNGNITITDSIINTYGIIESDKAGSITINGGSIKAYGLLIPEDSASSNIVIQNHVDVNLSQIEFVDIPNMYIRGPFITCPNKIEIKDNSKVKLNGIVQSNTLEISESNLMGGDYNRYHSPQISVGTLSASYSDIEMYGPVIAATIQLDHSTLYAESDGDDTLKSKYGSDYAEASAIITQTMDLIDSEFRAVSFGDVPALICITKPTTNKDNQVIINDNLDILEFKTVNYYNYGFTPTTTGYNSFILNGFSAMTGYTAMLGDSAQYEVTTAETVEVTLKIKNGTWEDGTTDEKKVTIIKGVTPDKDTFKSVPNIDGYVLSIKETGDNEYTFVYSFLFSRFKFCSCIKVPLPKRIADWESSFIVRIL